jgi:hypothetical protein
MLFQLLQSPTILVDHETGGIGKVTFLSFHAYVDHQIGGRTCHVRQFEGKVVLDFELDSKSDSWIPNWLGLPPCCACFLGSLAPS